MQRWRIDDEERETMPLPPTSKATRENIHDLALALNSVKSQVFDFKSNFDLRVHKLETNNLKTPKKALLIPWTSDNLSIGPDT